MNLKVITFCTIALLSTLQCHPEIIPSTNRIDWSLYAGIPGGIPHRSTVYTNLPAGVSMATINSAIANCPSNQVVQLSNGTYTVSADLSPRSYVTLRGYGSNTIIQTSVGWYWAGDTYRYGWATDIAVSSGYATGSSNLVLASAPTDLGPGCIFLITELNDSPWVDPCGFENCSTCELSDDLDIPHNDGTRVRGQILEVTGVTNLTNIAFWPPISRGYTAGLSPKISYCPKNEAGDRNVLTSFGIEDLVITNTANPGTAALWFEHTSRSWLSNVTMLSAFSDAAAVQCTTVHRLQIEHCTFVNTSDRGVGILTFGNCDGWLVQNNIFASLNRSFLANGNGGHHVLGYNYSPSKTNVSTAAQSDIWQHRSHPQFVLIEGNSMWSACIDHIHGSGSWFVFLRNHMKGWHPWETWAPACISIDAKNYWCSIVGNVLGYTNITTNAFGMNFDYEKESPGDCSDRGDVNPRNCFTWGWTGGKAYTNDTYSRLSATVTGNFDYMRNSNHWDGAISDHDVPTSYFYASKPSWFGGLTWPPIDNNTPGYSSSTTNIPAGYRYTFGTNPPAFGDQVEQPRRLRAVNARVGTIRPP